MKLNCLVDFNLPLENSIPIEPKFPNWEKSFVSGPESPLYLVQHRISSDDPTLLFTQLNFKPRAEGPPGHVHGGATAGVIDEVMGIIVWHHNYFCVTEKLSLHYLRALPLNDESIIVTKIITPIDSRAKRIEVHSTIYNKQKSPFVTAQGLFHRLTLEQLNKFKP
jgi:acyl-coenzyme A thioesterase PaaI-like protein